MGLRISGTPPFQRASYWALRFAAIVLWAALASVLAYVLWTSRIRILDGTEGALQFNAARIREHLPLWVDPAKGAWEYGAVPARYFVVYTGVWAYALASFPAAWGELPARAVATIAWFGLLSWIVVTSPRERRSAVGMAAVFAGGVYTSALFGSMGRPDSPALLLAGIGLCRAVRHDRVESIDGALFALAAFIKPSVIGIAGGALAGELVLRRERAWPAFVGAATTSILLALVLHLLSGGQWLTHVLRANYGQLRLSFWLGQAVSGLQFFGVPLGFAMWCAWRARRYPGVLRALLALVSSTAWTLFTIAKAGAARNYWMEPSVAAVVVFSQAPLLLPVAAGTRFLGAVLAVVQSVWTGVASIRSSIESIALVPAQRAILDRARFAIGARAGEIVLGEDPGLEWFLNGRLVQTPIYMTALGRAGRYPVDLWLEDVNRPEVVGIVMLDDLLERPTADQDVSRDLLLPRLRVALNRRFSLVEQAAGVYLYGLRNRR